MSQVTGLTFRSELQRDGVDGAAPAGPALQVEASVAGVDVGEHRLLLVELGLCGDMATHDNMMTLLLSTIRRI